VPDRDRRPAAFLAERWPLLTPLVLLAAATAYGLRALLAATGGPLVYTLDDAYTHLAMARTFAVDGLWGCTPHAFASASSSPAWVVALALAYVATGGVRETAPLVLNLIFAVLTLVAADHWLRRAQASPLLRAAALVGLVLVFPMAPMALYGMEHLLHGMLTIAFAGLAAWTIAEPQAVPRASRWLPVLGALLAGSRYEGFFLVGAVCLAFACTGRLRQGILIGAASAAPAVVLGLVSVTQGSPFLPNPLVLKAGGTGASPLTALFKPIGPEDWAAYRANRGLLWVLVGALAVVADGLARDRTVRRVPTMLALLLAASVALHQHFAFSSAFWVYRYDAYLLAFGVFTLGVRLARAEASAPGIASWRSAAAALALLGLVTSLSGIRSALDSAAEARAASLTAREHQQLARFVATHYPDATVAVNDIGVMAYRAPARVIDVFGLCNVEPVLLRRQPSGYAREDVRAWMAREHATIAILQLSWGWVPPHVPAEWRQVAELRIEPEGRVIGFFAIDPAVSLVDFKGDVGEFFQPMAEANGYQLRLF